MISKSKIFLIIFIVCILFSITTASANQDLVSNNTDILKSDMADDAMQLDTDSNQDDLCEGDKYSFYDFKSDAENCGGTLNLEHDYVCNNGTAVNVDVADNLIINGNGHCLDSANLTSGIPFNLKNSSSKLVINDLTFKNFKGFALSLGKGKITLNNVSFTNCTNKFFSLIFADDGVELTLNNSRFICPDFNDMLIYGTKIKLTILNSKFYGECDFPLITQNRGQLIVENSTFENFKAKIGAAINFKGDYFSIKNSKFLNSHANLTGGAIIAKYFPIHDVNDRPIPSEGMLIENCVFSNLSSLTDGGAIYIDLDSGSEGIKQSLKIINSNFTDCTSRFGGAIAIQGGNLSIEDSNFINNSAGFEGGALFTSWCNVTVVNSSMVNNTAQRNAGAIYFDKGKLTIKASTIVGNRALIESKDVANAIYAHDVDAYFANSTFNNGGISVYADFASNSKLENLTESDDIFLMDNKNYMVSIESKGIKLNLTKNSIIVDEIPSKYDLRNWGWVSPAKYQGENDDCWAFATAASMESSLLKSTGVLYNLSQNYIQKLNLKYFRTGDIRISLTGFAYSGLGYALSWIGTLQADAPYDDRGMLVDADFEGERIHLQDAMIIFGGRNDTKDLIKQAILKYGAVSVQISIDEPGSVVWTGEAVMDHDIHFVSIIGWDDNKNIELGNGSGVWITKDSLTGFDEIPYVATSLLAPDYFAVVPQNAAVCYIFENDIDYHVNYQTDFTGLTGFDGNYTSYSNEFTSKYSEFIGAVGTYFNESGIDYSFDIYVNGVKVHSQNGVSECAGFRTIVLDKYIPVNAGDSFRVEFKNNALPYQAFSRQHYIPGMSMVSADGESWKDITLENKTVCLKVYTVADDCRIIENKNITVVHGEESYFTVRVVTGDGRPVGAGENVTFTISTRSVNATTDNNGVAKIMITEAPGIYTITSSINGNAYENTVTVFASLEELKQLISESEGMVNLSLDYKSDSIELLIEKSGKFVINGNGHTIYGINSGLFTLNSDDVIIINNLTFKECRNFTINVISPVVLNDVQFINCSSEDGGNFLGSITTNLTLNNCIFKMNSGNYAAVYMSQGNLIVNNSLFDGQFRNYQNIYSNRANLVVENTTFANINSSVASAINFKGWNMTVKNSRFLNLHADLTGGAILAKFFPSDDKSVWEMNIDECRFINVSSSHDGGAIYLDLHSGSNGVIQTLNIRDAIFNNCSSEYGGAVVVLGGVLNIANTTFENNRAGFEGGAIYSSWADVNISGSTFSNNIAEKNAGAIYFDRGTLYISSSSLTGNAVSGQSGNAIYANDANLYFANSTFENGQVGVYGNFIGDYEMENIKGDDVFSLNNKDYIVFVENKGIKLNFANNTIIVQNLPSRYNSGDWGWLTPEKNQGDNYDCWAFATVAALETNLLKATGVAYNLSQNYVQHLQLKYYPIGDLRNNITGFDYSGLGHALSWYGVLLMTTPYDDRGMVSDTDMSESRIHLQDAMFIYGGQNNTIELIKRAVLKYGSVAVEIITTDKIDSNHTEQSVHFVSIVGWDDSRDDYVDGEYIVKPGVWITKDSMGGVGSFSYYDNSVMAKDYYAIVPQNAGIVYIFENNIDYHVNYQTDLTGLVGFDANYTYYSNEFTSKYSELIGAVGTYFNESGIGYSFDIYVNGAKVHSQSGVSEFAGFRTIVLNKYIPIKAGDKFKVVFKNNALPYQAFSRQHYIPGMSMVSADGNSWSDITLQDKTVCLKVYTVRDDTKVINNRDITVDYDGGSYFSVKVVTADGRAVGAGAIVKFTINGKAYSVATDNDGVARIKINELPKKYTITTSYNGASLKNTVTVKQVLTASKITIKKKTAKKLVLKAKLKINGKLVKGKRITFKFKGKTYKVKTNKKGIAQKTLNKKVIKKLKKGKKYTVKVTYLKDTIKTTVRVK